VNPAEEKELMQFASDGLVLGMTVCSVLAWERPPRPWPEQVLPDGLATMMLVTPYHQVLQSRRGAPSFWLLNSGFRLPE
jgi:hypothetical protein